MGSTSGPSPRGSSAPPSNQIIYKSPYRVQSSSTIVSQKRLYHACLLAANSPSPATFKLWIPRSELHRMPTSMPGWIPYLRQELTKSRIMSPLPLRHFTAFRQYGFTSLCHNPKPVSWVAVSTANLQPAALAAETHWSVFNWVGLKML